MLICGAKTASVAPDVLATEKADPKPEGFEVSFLRQMQMGFRD